MTVAMAIKCKVRACVARIPSAVLFAAFAAPILFAPLIAVAHHSPAVFDTRKTATVTGTVKKYEWFNPHVYITLEQITESGQKIELEIECHPPSAMRRMGWTTETLKVGDVLSITGSPARDPNSKGFLAGSIKRADKTLLDAGDFSKAFVSSADSPRFAAKGLEGNWLTQVNMQLVAQIAFPSTTKMTSEGARIFKSFEEKSMSPAANCISATAPTTMLMPDMKYVNLRDGTLQIRSEFDDAQRTIHLNTPTHDGAIPSHQGHSIAKWEGKTLVIDTTHFAYHGFGNGLGVPSSSKKRLTEWLTPGEDGTTLTYRFEVHDPEFFKAARVGEVKWTFRPDMKFQSEPCNLESARRFIGH